MARRKPVGWRKEPVRHGLAAKGVKTGMKNPAKMKRQPIPETLMRGHASQISRILRNAGVNVLSKPTGLSRIGTPFGYQVTFMPAGWVLISAAQGTSKEESKRAAKILRERGFDVELGRAKSDPSVKGLDLVVTGPA